jgi:hypothetical protein
LQPTFSQRGLDAAPASLEPQVSAAFPGSIGPTISITVFGETLGASLSGGAADWSGNEFFSGQRARLSIRRAPATGMRFWRSLRRSLPRFPRRFSTRTKTVPYLAEIARLERAALDELSPRRQPRPSRRRRVALSQTVFPAAIIAPSPGMRIYASSYPIRFSLDGSTPGVARRNLRQLECGSRERHDFTHDPH